ncbi:MAG: hypothetical protein SF069_02755 [Phycisphaerae bacterium]|nr:hypothetical protein [Phycisphaerae bacterium]
MVWWVLFRPEALMAASEWPLRADASRRFWLWTVAGVSAVILASLLLHFASVMPPSSSLLCFGVLAVAIPVALSVATSALATDRHPVSGVAEERERGIALSYYLSALAWPLGLACAAVSGMYWVFPINQFNFPVLVGATLLLLTVGAGFWVADLAAYISQIRLRARGPYTTFGWSAMTGMGLAIIILVVASWVSGVIVLLSGV